MNAPIVMPRQTLHDLMAFDGKAELIGGRVVEFMASGIRPNIVAKRVVRSLDDWIEAGGHVGTAFTDGIGFAVPELTSGRESFSPDAAYYAEPLTGREMWFVEGPATFAVEVRSEHDYGPYHDREYAAKRVDYFEAGTLVVWDVDPVAGTVACYRASDPLTPRVFGAGDESDAEPACPDGASRSIA